VESASYLLSRFSEKKRLTRGKNFSPSALTDKQADSAKRARLKFDLKYEVENEKGEFQQTKLTLAI
jgi:hypothetical protein